MSNIFNIRSVNVFIVCLTLVGMLGCQKNSSEEIPQSSENLVISYDISERDLNTPETGTFSDGQYHFSTETFISLDFLETMPVLDQFGSDGKNVELIAELDFASLYWQGWTHDYDKESLFSIYIIVQDQNDNEQTFPFRPNIMDIGTFSILDIDEYVVTRSNWHYATKPLTFEGKVSKPRIVLSMLLDNSKISLSGLKLKLRQY